MSPANNEQAAEFLKYVGQNHALLKTYARNLCKNMEEADDLLQETIVRCHDTIGRRGFTGSDFRLYLFAALKANFYHIQRDKKNKPLSIQDPAEMGKAMKIADRIFKGHFGLSSLLNVGDSSYCNEKVDALALQIDVYVTSHFPARHVGWWQLHLKGLTYQEIGFGDNITPGYVHRIIKEIKAELREEFRRQVLDLGRD